VDFRLDDQQLALQQTVADFCAARYPLGEIARRPLAGTGSDPSAWAELCDLGVTTILVPEAHGGLGLDLFHAAIVFEQLGRRLVPGPLLWSSLGAALLGDGSPRTPMVSGWDAVAEPDGPILIEHADDLDGLIVLRPGGVAWIERAELGAPQMLDPLDPLTPVGRYHGLPAGRLLAGPEEADLVRSRGTVLAAALLVGVAQAALDVARDYSLERRQFDRPIASFQALKHMMADMFVRLSLARSSTYAAAAVVGDPEIGDVVRSVSGAKLLAGEAAVENSRCAVQILGGMGFTWDMPPNFLLKRAWVLEQSFGTSTAHALTISDAMAGATR